ncbi:non-canonical purine NTP pyrophosphatase [Subtercola boreus]|uniref:dITP/XTP pyrophosphatase n=1 Tax=Subtercola boreus TaxID=120213 RepID=A0A3E0W9M2_9MICO|nr:non-canonical purine NTP pyrophosphatase [Subtercola boreus]RFA20340.1 non-canonical purine NTP pyrophosphatase [Subtercola boreus]RFA20494.1 non-canonical purine NTP pyrophosphatase [Subtercola boreus]RFA26743.1 non-canonical purine NTP pyrophosphatase [Subtercola boreus]
MNRVRVVLATHNQHKVDEFQKILGARLPELDIVKYDGPEPVEDGTTFNENALIKARAAALHTGLPALADDSGITVDILGGSPGIFSARWAGHGKGDLANRELLLDQLADIHDDQRGAAFVCHIAVVVPAALRPETPGAAPDAAPDDQPYEDVAAGFWRGSLLRESRGANGFGYDPVFVPAGLTVTAAELSPDEKNAISHRALAFSNVIPLLRMNVIPI